MGNPISAAVFSIPARSAGLGNSSKRNVSSALLTGFPSRVMAVLVTAKPEPSCTICAVMERTSPGVTKVRSLASFTAARRGIRVNLDMAISSQPEVCAIASISSTPGISGWPGKCPSKIVELVGTVAWVRMVWSPILSSTIRSISTKYSRRIRSRLGWRRALGRYQFVNARAEVLQYEVLLGGRLTVVDFLGPLLKRQLDAERLVDRERNVEEVEAVDPEVVDRMALRRDLLAVDIAGFGN